MKLGEILLLGLTLAFLIIGIDQTLISGFSHAYWAYMIALVSFFAFTLRRIKKSGVSDDHSDHAKKRKK